jgi:hypothetical protein
MDMVPHRIMEVPIHTPMVDTVVMEPMDMVAADMEILTVDIKSR